MSRMFSRLATAIAIAALSIGLIAEPASAFNNGDAVTYTQSITTPANPVGNFTGSSGKDTWSIGVDNGNIYGVVHIPMYGQTPPFRFEVVCNSIADGSVCPNYPVNLNTYAINGGMADFYIDPVTHYMYSYATQSPTGVNSAYPDGNWGVLCFDTSNPLNPVCGFTSYVTKSGNPIFSAAKSLIYNKKMYSAPASTGTDANIPAGSNIVMCFDLTTKAKCAGQPYLVDSNEVSAVDVGQIWDVQRIGNSSKMLINTVNKGFCFDMETNTGCSGNWPITYNWGTAPNTVSERSYAQYSPVLNDNGDVTGFCYTKVSNASWNCLDFTAASISVPAGLATVLDPTFTLIAFNNTVKNIYLTRDPLQFGTRIYVMHIDSFVAVGAAGAYDQATVLCFDYATHAACPDFSKLLTGAYYPYLFYTNQLQPTCVWASSDQGPAQMQNFDLYTGGACGSGGSRILVSSYIEPGSNCAPVSYGTLKINSPTNYASAKVTLLDKNGVSLGIAQQTFNGSREVDLSSLTLPTASGSQPQLLIELRDGSNNLINTAIDASLSWAGTYNTSCVANGQTAVARSVGPSITSAAEVTVERGTLPVLNNTTDITSPTWSIDGGADAGKFEITSGGQLKFKSTQPVGDYVVIVKATHGSDTATKTVTVHVVDTTDPEFTAPETSVEHGTSGTIANPSNVTEPGTWSLGDLDGDLFNINPTTGALSLKDPNQAIGDYTFDMILTDPSGNHVTHQATIHILAHIEVGSPAPATRTNISGGKTRVNWTTAANAVTYKVKLGSTVLCTTTNTTCVIPHRYVNSKNLYVYAIASNNDTKSTLAVPQDAETPNTKVKLGMVHFALDSSYIDLKAVKLLNKYIKAIKAAGYTKVYIYGHTDNQGPAPHDISLSNRRARQVWLYLKKRLPNITFVRAGYSRTKPAKANTSNSNKAYNRRAEIWGA